MATVPVFLHGNFMDRQMWWATSHGVSKSDMHPELSMHTLLMGMIKIKDNWSTDSGKHKKNIKKKDTREENDNTEL